MLVRLKITANVFGCLAAVASAFDDMIELPLIGRTLLSHFGMPLSTLIYGSFRTHTHNWLPIISHFAVCYSKSFTYKITPAFAGLASI